LDLFHDGMVKGLSGLLSTFLNFLIDPGVVVEFTSLLEVLVGFFVIFNPVLFNVVSLKFE